MHCSVRRIVLGEVEIEDGDVETGLTCQYHLLIRVYSSGVESYGLGVTILQTGESADFWDITPLSARIEALAALLMQGQVTPCILRDILEDLL